MTANDFYPFVLPSVPNCPDPVADHHIRMACRAFCQGTLIWVEELDGIIADGYAREFALPLAEDTEAFKFSALSIDGVEVNEFRDFVTLRKLERDGNLCQTAGLSPDRKNMFISPAPKAGAVLLPEIVLQPSFSAVELPDLLGQHAEAIGYGALSTLLDLDSAEWRNQEAAAAKRVRFTQAIASVGMQVSNGASPKKRRARSSRFM